ncbi:PadR family transcriptional regulator [Streptomyces tendae]|uniref:PadR family transcriptional regulator n=2 Tax=Streptomyces tendae TaxID=1932 RepID=A0A6B3QYR3_STRTE|nr:MULTISPECIES: PadR family transcriptional regulator [Streptomyces]BET52026.1 PadR family transcriptional regulator [Kitasatospora aureofaciens]MBQ0966622.1 PadR family transcriptional regulator [Streptomyces sp. RK74B]MBQ1007095.1 PadR family transcriptional regulator [Streptomyces sp. RK23]MCW1099253.1 PadR family transcriptional regulator [Streptomyces sp. RS2]NEV92270.1 PadR family transcriptional regulator [Streptomyces tendae]
MSLKYAVLAALLEGEASGYELSKIFDVSLANFWPATPQQLYRELERLAGDGLIAARTVPQERRPTKRLFSLTEAGREQLGVFAAEPTRRPTAVRDEFLIKMQAMDGVDPAAVRALVEERRAWALGKLARYERVRERLLDGRTEEEHLREADRVGPYLTLAAGITFERENARWCERVLTVLDGRRAPAGPAGQPLG